MGKRVFDFVSACCGVVVLAPVLVVVSLMIKRHDGGPVFYVAPRVGLGKKPFRMYKFRTMVMNADKIGGPTTGKHDPRITPVGHMLRRFKLDELPQLFNVIKGDMSLVGPRPEVPSEVAEYGPEWDVIFQVKPGITDLASIEFRNESEIIARSGIADPHEAYRTVIQPKKLALQKAYVLHRSFITDIRIILQTLMTVVGKAQ